MYSYLSKDIANEEDRDHCIVLFAMQTDIFLEGSQSSCSDVITVEVVKNVCNLLAGMTRVSQLPTYRLAS